MLCKFQGTHVFGALGCLAAVIAERMKACATLTESLGRAEFERDSALDQLAAVGEAKAQAQLQLESTEAKVRAQALSFFELVSWTKPVCSVQMESK